MRGTRGSRSRVPEGREAAMTDVKDSHYVSRFLLRNWEHAAGKLHYFDFGTGRIHRSSAKSMYTSPTTFPADVEAWQSRVFETPLGGYIARAKVAHARGDAAAPVPTPSEWRAITVALLAQPFRTAVARGSRDGQLDLLASKDERDLDDVVDAVHQDRRLFVRFGPTERLCFPEAGIAPLPLIGSIRGFFLPLAPTVFAAIIPREVREESFKDLVHDLPGVASLLSVGIEGDRVVLPPLSEGADFADVAARVRSLREAARRIVEGFHKANKMIERDLGLNLGAMGNEGGEGEL